MSEIRDKKTVEEMDMIARKARERDALAASAPAGGATGERGFRQCTCCTQDDGPKVCGCELVRCQGCWKCPRHCVCPVSAPEPDQCDFEHCPGEVVAWTDRDKWCYAHAQGIRGE